MFMLLIFTLSIYKNVFTFSSLVDDVIKLCAHVIKQCVLVIILCLLYFYNPTVQVPVVDGKLRPCVIDYI